MLQENMSKNDSICNIGSNMLFFIAKLQNFLIAPRTDYC